jgi:hypothetical protein
MTEEKTEAVENKVFSEHCPCAYCRSVSRGDTPSAPAAPAAALSGQDRAAGEDLPDNGYVPGEDAKEIP